MHLPDTPCRLCHTPLDASTILPDGILTDRFHRTRHLLAFRNVWGMAHYRQWQPPARFAPIAERDHCPTGKAPAELPGRTGELVDLVRLELTTPRLQGGCSPN